MTPEILKQRSSWPSSFLTGLIGWNGFTLAAALLFGVSVPADRLFLFGSAVAIAQVLILRLGFFRLGLQRSLKAGIFWGAFSGALLTGAAIYFLEFLKPHWILWM